MDRAPLATWVHPKGRLALLGDSCHPMLVRSPLYYISYRLTSLQPYRAQGAGMAIEDAAVLGDLFSRVSSLKQVPALLQAYQDLRFVTLNITARRRLPSDRSRHQLGCRVRRMRSMRPA